MTLAGRIRAAFRSRAPDRAAVETVKAWAAARLDAASGTALVVNEIVCTDPSCPGVETVILILEPGRKTRACKIPKALEDVTEADVADALA